MYKFLSDPAWQGISAIVGIVSVIISLWLTRNPSPKNKATNINDTSNLKWRTLMVILSLIIPAYAIFVGSILFVNILTTIPEIVVYGSVAIASLLGIVWGIIWGMYIQSAIFTDNSRLITRKFRPGKG